MVDCILEEYLAAHPDTQYPDAPEVRDGHRMNDYSRAFFPLYTNRELFQPARAFGYTCRLGAIPEPEPGSGAGHLIPFPLLLLAAIVLTSVAIN